MTITKRTLDLRPRPMLRLSEIERLIREHRIIVPPPGRRWLITLCEEGILETAPRRSARSNYLVYEDSFLRWIESLTKPNGS